MKEESKKKMKLFSVVNMAELSKLPAGLVQQVEYGVPNDGIIYTIGTLGQIIIIILGIITLVKGHKKGLKKTLITMAILIVLFIAITFTLYLYKNKGI